MLDFFRQKSRSTLIYLMFAAVIIIFAFGFGAGGSVCNPGGGPGGPGGQTIEVANIDGEPLDSQLVNLAKELSFEAVPPRSRSQDAAMRQQYYKATRFWNLGFDGPFSGGRFNRDPETVSPILELKVVDELIESRLVAGYAKSLGMAVSAEEMNLRLARLLKGFRDEKTGEFDRGAYANWLNRLGASAPTFESFVKDEILRERVIGLLVGEVGVADAEIEAQYRLENDKVKVAYISIDKSSAKPLVPVTDAEVTTYLEANAQKVADEYEKKKATEFTTPRTFSLRMIKIDAADPGSTDDAEQKTALEEERKAARAKADQALADVKAKLAAAPAPAPDAPAPDAPAPDAPAPDAPAPDAPAPVVDAGAVFGEIATTVSDDATKDAGGKLAEPVKLPQLARSPYGAAVAASAANWKLNEPSEVIETPTAFFIFMPESITEEVVKTLDEAKPIIAKGFLQDERVDAFRKTLADEVKAEAAKNPTGALADVAKAINAKYGAAEGKGLQARDSDEFARLQAIAPGYPTTTPYIFGIGKSASLVRAAFAASLESPLLPEIYEVTGDKLVVARLLEKKAAEAMGDDAKKEVRERLGTERRRALYRGWYEDLLAKKMAAGDVELTDDFAAMRKQLEESFVQQGGILPGMTPPATGAAGGPGGPTIVTLPANQP